MFHVSKAKAKIYIYIYIYMRIHAERPAISFCQSCHKVSRAPCVAPQATYLQNPCEQGHRVTPGTSGTASVRHSSLITTTVRTRTNGQATEPNIQIPASQIKSELVQEKTVEHK